MTVDKTIKLAQVMAWIRRFCKDPSKVAAKETFGFNLNKDFVMNDKFQPLNI